MPQYLSSQEILKRCFNNVTGKLNSSTHDLQDYLNAVYDPVADGLRIEGGGGNVSGDVIECVAELPEAIESNAGRVVYYTGETTDGGPTKDTIYTLDFLGEGLGYEWRPTSTFAGLLSIKRDVLVLPLNELPAEVSIDVNGAIQNIDDDGDMDGVEATHYRIDIDGYVMSVENYASDSASSTDRYYGKLSYDFDANVSHVYMTVEEYGHVSSLSVGKNILVLYRLDRADSLLPSGELVVNNDISDLSDAMGLWASKENKIDKATDFTTVNDTKYPTVKAVVDYVSLYGGFTAVSTVESLPPDAVSGAVGMVSADGLYTFYQKGAESWGAIELSSLDGALDAMKAILGEDLTGDPIWENGKSAYELWLDEGNTGSLDDFFDDIGGLTTAEKDKLDSIYSGILTPLSGTDVTMNPWVEYDWSASGVCSIDFDGFSLTGKETAFILIDFASGATLSLPEGTVVNAGDEVSLAGLYECYVVNLKGVMYFRVANFTEAA